MSAGEREEFRQHCLSFLLGLWTEREQLPLFVSGIAADFKAGVITSQEAMGQLGEYTIRPED